MVIDFARAAIFPLTAATILGSVGAIVGYFSPAAFDPNATVGALTGIFVTGPMWAVIGLGLGTLAVARRMTGTNFALGLALFSIIAAVSSAAICVPEDRLERTMIKGEIVRCQSPDALVPAATDRWKGSVGLRSEWREDVSRMLKNDRGAVITLRVTSTKEVYRSRKPWSRGELVSKGWKATHRVQDYFAAYNGDNCKAYPLGLAGRYAVEWLPSEVSPPDLLPTFLGLHTLQPTSE